MAVVCVPGITLPLMAAETSPTLRWDAALGEPAVWDTGTTAVWEDEKGVESTYTSGSHVVFGEDDALNKAVEIVPEGVNAAAVELTGSGYSISGGDLVVSDLVSAEKSATIESTMVMGSTTSPLEIRVAEGQTLTTNILETSFAGSHEHHIYEQGSFVKTGSGTLRIMEAAHGSITGVTVQEGVLELGQSVSLDMGAYAIHGGTLENVQMLVSGDMVRTLTGVTVLAHNMMVSADGVHAAVLRDVQLHAGTTIEYASMQNVVFAGESTLTGYITFEETQSQREMGVATGSTLAVDNVVFDLHGLSAGTKVLIVNGEVADAANGLQSRIELPSSISGLAGTITGWDTAKFVYSGVAVNKFAVQSTVAGTVTIIGKHDGNLYWDGSEDDKWNPTSANWSLTAGTQGEEVFTALSNVYFGGGDEVVHRDITVTQDMVVMNLNVTNGDYNFRGARVATLADATLAPSSGKVTFHDQLVVQGYLTTGGAGTVELLGATTVVKDATLQGLTTSIAGDMSILGSLIVNAGDATAAGRLNISGDVTAAGMEIVVNAGDKDGSAYDQALVNVTGTLSVGKTGTITIGGTAEQHYTESITAGQLIVNTQQHEVYFGNIHVNSLTVAEGAYVHVQSASESVAVSSSSFPQVNLAGTLALDAYGTTYNHGYEILVQSDAAQLRFGTGCTVENMAIRGTADADGYTDLGLIVQARSATVTQMRDLGNLTVRVGAVTVKNATGAIHGSLTLDNGKLTLAENANDFMAAGSGAIVLKNGSRLDVGSTTQSISAGNAISLSGGSVINGAADGAGLQLADGVRITYADAGNGIKANLSVGDTLTLHADQPTQDDQPTSTLNISGTLSGNGVVSLTGEGTVALSGAQSFTGTVQVEQGATLEMLNATTLAQAGVVLGNGATLALDTASAVQLNSLTLSSGSTISYSTITDTDEFSAAAAALQVGTAQMAAGENTLVLNVSFSDELKTMRTYNLMTGLSSIDNISLNVQHNNGVELGASQYKLGLDAESGLLYIHTLMGNVWEGKGKQTNGRYYVWSTTDQGGNWSSGNGNYDENAEYKAAIFGDLDGGASTIAVYGTVNPGDIYFIADSTDYVFNDHGAFAAGTHIHKDGEARVDLMLYNNMSADSALGNIDIQAGTLAMNEAYAVGGTVTVDHDAQLVLQGGSSFGVPIELKMGPAADGSFKYTVAGVRDDKMSPPTYRDAVLSGVTLDAAGIRGTSEDLSKVAQATINGTASVSHLTLEDTHVLGNVDLTHVKLTTSDNGTSQKIGYYAVKDATIGQNVLVDESGRYYFTGNLTFNDVLVNKGIIYLTDAAIEIGQLKYEFATDAAHPGAVTYRFIQHEKNAELNTGRFDIYSHQALKAYQVMINGVRLDGTNTADGKYVTGLADGIVADFADNQDGSVTLSIGNDTNGDGIADDTSVGMPQWDERWGKVEKSPALSRRYAGSDEKFFMAAGGDYYTYASVVNEANADKVNDGKAIVVSLTSAATGSWVAGGKLGATRPDYEVWIHDRSAIERVIGGQYEWVDTPQSAATHVLVDTAAEKTLVVGGSYHMDQNNAESFVTVRNGNIHLLVGGSYEWGVSQKGTAHVFVDDGTIGEIFAAGYDVNLTGTQVVDGRLRAVEMVLAGGTLGAVSVGGTKRVFGGGHGPDYTVKGDIYIRMKGDAYVQSQLVGGSNGGTVNGNIVLDLMSGGAMRVDAAGMGWGDGWTATNSITNGDVLVNLYRDFHLGALDDEGHWVGGQLYGGRELTESYVVLGDGYTSTLHLAEAGVYELGRLEADGFSTSADSVTVTGFDRITLADGAHAIVALGAFDNDMDTATTLEISGQGVVEVIGHGENFGRDILLTDDATLKISTSIIGKTDDTTDDRTVTVTAGTTVDFTGYPVESSKYEADSMYAGLGFNLIISGDGVDNKGAIYKGKPIEEVDGNKNAVNMISLPSVTLAKNASAKVERDEILYMNSNELGATHLTLNGYTFAKLGAGSLIARAVQMSKGTVLVHDGIFAVDLESTGTQTDMVLAADASLHLNSTAENGDTSLVVRSLSGSGVVALNDSALTLQTTGTARYHESYMDETQSYGQFMNTTGFAHAVFGGTITDGNKAGGTLIKAGEGVHYLSGSSSTYTGGTRLQGGRLYLLGSSSSAEGGFSKGNSTVASGVVGTGTIVWASDTAELYLGHEAHIYNAGTTHVQGGGMTIGVEGAPAGKLANFVGVHSKDANGALTYVTMGGEEYVEIETHNLYSIAVDAKYADGSDYKAGSEINHDLMLLVKKDDWAAAQGTDVTGFADTGYNEAIFSGELRDTKEGNTVLAATLHKVGVGTLVLDQTNSYSGGTRVSEGSLWLRGWGTAGKNEKTNAVVVEAGASLLLTYKGSYGDEPTLMNNDITIAGSGDARWLSYSATDGNSAALISAVGRDVSLTLSGDIDGSGDVLHSGDGRLVLCGDSSYTGGTHAIRGTIEVQSAKGLGATATGQGAVRIEAAADLRLTVEDGYAESSRMVTTLAADVNDIQGDVYISGTETTERVLHMDGNGYNAALTHLGANGTFVLNGEAIGGKAVSAHSKLLEGEGTVVVSDASGSGANIVFDSMIDYRGDFRVEGDKASITVEAGTFIDGSVHVAGQQASLHVSGDITIADGEKLSLSSTGDASVSPAEGESAGVGTSAAIITTGAVNVTAGAVFSVSKAETVYEYDLSSLQKNVSVAVADMVQGNAVAAVADLDHTAMGNPTVEYSGSFDQTLAMNKQAAAAVQTGTAAGLTLAGGATYETKLAHTSLMGGALTLDTLENNLIVFHTELDTLVSAVTSDMQLILFSDVGSVNFVLDGVIADANTGIYYAQADRYLTGSEYIGDTTLLVYDSNAAVVYLQDLAVPEPTTTTLSLLALAALLARRRRQA